MITFLLASTFLYRPCYSEAANPISEMNYRILQLRFPKESVAQASLSSYCVILLYCKGLLPCPLGLVVTTEGHRPELWKYEGWVLLLTKDFHVSVSFTGSIGCTLTKTLPSEEYASKNVIQVKTVKQFYNWDTSRKHKVEPTCKSQN